MTFSPGSCALKPWGWARGYFGHGDPDTTSACGVKFTLNAAPRTGPDTGQMWYYGGLDSDSVYVGSGGVQPSGDKPITITLDKPIRNVQIVWQFSPAPGGKITLYNSQDSVLEMHDVGSSPEPSPYPAGGSPSGFHTQETHVFASGGVQKIRLEGGGRLPWTSQSWILAQVFFDPDTVFCPPYLFNNQYDSVLNNPLVRRALEDLLVEGNAFDVVQANRSERVKLVMRNSDGSLRVDLPSSQLNRLCNSIFPLPLFDPDLVAILHSHPFTQGELTPCGENPPNPYDPPSTGGGSGGDYFRSLLDWIRRRGQGLPDFRDIVIDKDSIWAMKPGALPDDGPGTVKRHPRIELSCVRVF